MIVVATVLAGCVPLPAAMMPLQGPSADPIGSTSIRLYGTLPVSLGLLLDEPPTLYGAGGLRLTHQLTPLFSVGVDGTYVNGLGSANNQRLFAERAQGRLSMLDDHLSLAVGVGAQTAGVANDKATETALTSDVALGFGWKLDGFEPYASAGTTLGFALWPSPPPPEGYFFAAIGFAGRPAPGWRVAAEVDSFPVNYRVSAHPEQGALNPAVMPTVSAAYVFGDGLP